MSEEFRSNPFNPRTHRPDILPAQKIINEEIPFENKELWSGLREKWHELTGRGGSVQPTVEHSTHFDELPISVIDDRESLSYLEALQNIFYKQGFSPADWSQYIGFIQHERFDKSVLMRDIFDNTRRLLFNTKRIMNHQFPSAGLVQTQESHDACLQIEDPFELMNDIVRASNVLREHKDNAWIRGQRIGGLLQNAAISDFKDPHTFLAQMQYMIEDRSIEHISSDWESVGYLVSLEEDLYVRHTVPKANYEAPHDIEVSAVKNSQPTAVDALPTVRVGRIADDAAIIYAVQMPKLDEYSSNTGAQLDTEIGKIREQFQTALSMEKKIWDKLFDPEEQDLLLTTTSSSEFINTLYDKFKSEVQHFVQREDISLHDWQQWFYHSLKSLGGPYFNINIFSNIYDHHEKLDKLKQLNPVFEERSNRLKRFNNPLRGRTYDLVKATMPNDKLRRVPPAALVSLTAAVQFLHAQGVRNILFPTYLPLRQHAEPEVDMRILEQALTLFAREAVEIDGFNIETDPDRETYMKFSLDDNLTSNRPILNEIIDLVQRRFSSAHY